MLKLFSSWAKVAVGYYIILVFLIDIQACQFVWASFSSFITCQSSKTLELQVLPLMEVFLLEGSRLKIFEAVLKSQSQLVFEVLIFFHYFALSLLHMVLIVSDSMVFVQEPICSFMTCI